jgi:hypothetical protein
LFFELIVEVEDEVSINRTCSVLSQYDKIINGIPVKLDTIKQKCQFKIVGEK